MEGNITIDTNILEALNGGQINAASLSSGDAGNITLNVTDSVNLAGKRRLRGAPSLGSGLFANIENSRCSNSCFAIAFFNNFLDV